MRASDIVYYHDWNHPEAQSVPTTASIPITTESPDSLSFARPGLAKLAGTSIARSRINSFGGILGFGLLCISLGGLVATSYPRIRLEAAYLLRPKPQSVTFDKPQAVPAVFDPLQLQDGSSIEPVDRNFGLVIPKIGVNAPVVPLVDPTRPDAYLPALKSGIAHAATSFLPDQDGTVYLFSHSTNYEWFVDDLNAVFYLLKNVDRGDMVVLLYQDKTYMYQVTEKRIVSPASVSYLVPAKGAKKLILQTCWPPGSTTQRLLLFAELIQQPGEHI